jgi:hypothetical protein
MGAYKEIMIEKRYVPKECNNNYSCPINMFGEVESCKQCQQYNNIICARGYCYYDEYSSGERHACEDCSNSTYSPYDNKIKMCGTITWVQLLYSMFKNATVKELIEKGGMYK